MMVQYRPSPNEEERLLREERDRRRLLRLQQVREQAKDNAARVRVSVSEERERLLRQLGHRQENEWKQDHDKELDRMQQLYLDNILSLGQGHQSAADENIDGCRQERLERQAAEESKAKLRYQEALARQKENEWIKEEEKNRRVLARQIALDIERARAMAVADLPKPKPNPVDTLSESGMKNMVVSVDRDTFSSSLYHMADNMVEKSLHSVEGNAMDWALREQKRIDERDEELKKFSNESSDRANLRYKRAIEKDLLKKDYFKLLQDLSDIQREDLNKRRNRVEKLPKSVFEAADRRAEGIAEEQDMMERAFEHAYLNHSSPTLSISDEKRRDAETPATAVDLNEPSQLRLYKTGSGEPVVEVTDRRAGLDQPVVELTNRRTGLDQSLTEVTIPRTKLDQPVEVTNGRTGLDNRAVLCGRDFTLTTRADPDSSQWSVRESASPHPLGHKSLGEELGKKKGTLLGENKEHRYNGREDLADNERVRAHKGFESIGNTARDSGALQKLFSRIQAQRDEWLQNSTLIPSAHISALKPSSPADDHNKQQSESLLSEGTLSDDTHSSAGRIHSPPSIINRRALPVTSTVYDVKRHGDNRGMITSAYADDDVESMDSVMRTVKGVNTEIMLQSQLIEQQRQKLEHKLQELSSKKQQILKNQEFSLQSDAIHLRDAINFGHESIYQRHSDPTFLNSLQNQALYSRDWGGLSDRTSHIGEKNTNIMHREGEDRVQFCGALTDIPVTHNMASGLTNKTSPHVQSAYNNVYKSRTSPLGGRVGLSAIDSSLFPLGPLHPTSSHRPWSVSEEQSDLVERYLSLDRQRPSVEYGTPALRHDSMSASTPHTEDRIDGLVKTPVSSSYTSSYLLNPLTSAMLLNHSSLSSSEHLSGDLSMHSLPLRTSQDTKFSLAHNPYSYIPSTFDSLYSTKDFYPAGLTVHTPAMTTEGLNKNASASYTPIPFVASSSSVPYSTLRGTGGLMSSAFSTPEMQQHEVWRLKPDGSILSYDGKRSTATEIQNKSSVNGSPYLSDVTQYRSLPFPMESLSADVTLGSAFEEDNGRGVKPSMSAGSCIPCLNEPQLASPQQITTPQRIDQVSLLNDRADVSLAGDVREVPEHSVHCAVGIEEMPLTTCTPVTVAGDVTNTAPFVVCVTQPPTSLPSTAEGKAPSMSWQSILDPYLARDSNLHHSADLEHSVLYDDVRERDHESSPIHHSHVINNDGNSLDDDEYERNNDVSRREETGILEEPDLTLVSGATDLSLFDYEESRDICSTTPAVVQDASAAGARHQPVSPTPTKSLLSFEKHELSAFDDTTSKFHSTLDYESVEGPLDRKLLYDLEARLPSDKTLAGRGTGADVKELIDEHKRASESELMEGNETDVDESSLEEETAPGGSLGPGHKMSHESVGPGRIDDDVSVSTHQTASVEDLFLASMYSGGSGQTPRGSEGGMSSSLSDIHSARSAGPFVRHSSLSQSINSWKQNRVFGKRRVHPERDMTERRIEGQTDSDSCHTNTDAGQSKLTTQPDKAV